MDGIGKNTTPSAIADMSMMSAAAVAAVIFLDCDKGPPGPAGGPFDSHVPHHNAHHGHRHHHDGGRRAVAAILAPGDGMAVLGGHGRAHHIGGGADGRGAAAGP